MGGVRSRPTAGPLRPRPPASRAGVLTVGGTRGGDARAESQVIGFLPPSSRCRAAALAGTRRHEDFRPGWRAHSEVPRAVTLLTFHAVFLDTSGPLPSGTLAPDFLSWGCQMIAPPSYQPNESTPGGMSPCPPSGGRSQRHPRSALVVFHHLGGFLLARIAGMSHPASDHGVHRVSGGAIRHPRDAFLPSRALLPARSDAAPGHPDGHGPRHRHRPKPMTFTADLASSPSERRDGRRSLSSTSRPFSPCRAVPHVSVAADGEPLLSWACPHPLPPERKIVQIGRAHV